jgi:hypothetical protein
VLPEPDPPSLDPDPELPEPLPPEPELPLPVDPDPELPEPPDPFPEPEPLPLDPDPEPPESPDPDPDPEPPDPELPEPEPEPVPEPVLPLPVDPDPELPDPLDPVPAAPGSVLLPDPALACAVVGFMVMDPQPATSDAAMSMERRPAVQRKVFKIKPRRQNLSALTRACRHYCAGMPGLNPRPSPLDVLRDSLFSCAVLN